jgi:hypothetical protein
MWRPRIHHHLAALSAALLVGLLHAPLAAQEIPVWDPDESLGYDRSLSLGVEVGKPLIFGLEGGYNFTPHVSSQLGFSTLGDFTAISGGLRLNLLSFDLARALPYLEAGFTQYFLEDGARETTPITAHSVLGLEYVFLSNLGVAMNLGYQVALGNSEDPTVERYGINDDMSEWLFAVNARYFF